MDKYEFNIKIEQLKKLVKVEDYATALKICDGIDWRRVSSVSLLSMVSDVYEKNGDNKEAKDILLMAYERAPIGKRLLYKLCILALKENQTGEAEDYYREFYELAPDDPRQHILRYMILKAKGAPAPQLISSLENYTNTEIDEKYMYELAELYKKTGMTEKCIQACDKLILMFGIGHYVDKAKRLKAECEGRPIAEFEEDFIIDDNTVDAENVTEVTPEDGNSAEDKTSAVEESKTPQADEPEQRYTVNFIVERKTPQAGLESAKRLLKLMHDHTGSTNGVAKIKASKLNERGLAASADKIYGKDLIIEEAGDLSFDMVEQIIGLIRREPDKRIIVLIDNPMQLNNICNRHADLLNYFHMDRDDADEYAKREEKDEPVKEEAVKAEPVKEEPKVIDEPDSESTSGKVRVKSKRREEGGEPQMGIDEFAQYCGKYADSIDCSISGKSMLALYERIEIMEEEGIPLTAKNAVALIEEAADRAEKKTLAGLFSKKYDKNDKLILKEEHFIP